MYAIQMREAYDNKIAFHAFRFQWKEIKISVTLHPVRHIPLVLG